MSESASTINNPLDVDDEKLNHENSTDLARTDVYENGPPTQNDEEIDDLDNELSLVPVSPSLDGQVDEDVADVPNVDTHTNGNGPTNGEVQDDTVIQTNGETYGDGDIPSDGIKTEDNGLQVDDGQKEDEEPPLKRQKTRPTTPPTPSSAKKKVKPESPPWKKINAEGPTSYLEDGRRKSGRINTVPIQLQPQGSKRITRRDVNAPRKGPKHPETITNSRSNRLSNVVSKSTPSSKVTRRKSVSNSTPVSSAKKPAPQPRSSSKPSRHDALSSAQSTRHSSRIRHSSRLDEAEIPSYNYNGRSPRIKLRVGPSGVIPLVHADQVWKRPKIGTSFADFWERAGFIPVEEGGLYASEDGPAYTEETVLKEARAILRIEDAVEPGGILSEERCSLFIPEAGEEPPRQWARQDHMVKAMSNFRRLMSIEQTRHRQTAKRLAEACQEEWQRRQPKSTEQLEAEARALWISKYRLVVKAMFGTWENVRAYVNRQRLEEWEAGEQKRVKAALNEAVNLSEQKLQARRALDSEMNSEDDDGFDDLTDDANSVGEDDESNMASNESNANISDDEDSDNMSSSEDEDEVREDGGDGELTQEQLREKYANIPEIKTANGDENEVEVQPKTEDRDTSDESVDMDDDMGSSDMESDDDMGDRDSEEDDEFDEEDDAEGADGLLGLFFGKSELKELEAEKAEAPATEHGENDAPMTEAGGELAKNELSAKNEASEAETSDPREPTATTKMNVPAGVEAILDSEPVANGTAESALKGVDFAPKAKSSISHATVNEAELTPSPHTDAAAEHRSNGRSPSPSITSEIKPSETDSPAADKAVSKLSRSRSRTPATHASPQRTEIPFLLRGTLREYQHDGLDWLAGLYANNTNGILADEMGLGKTIQTIALLAHLACHHEVWGPHLVVVPTSVMLNWEMEFKKWCPGFKILAYYGTQEERKRKRQGWRSDDVWNVCITSYQLVLQDQQVFKRRRWHYLILDEAHNIKNFKSQRWQTLLGFNTQARLLLTGTPLQNNLTELWSLLFFLMPAENGIGGFADLQEFHDWFQKPESQILESGREQMDDEAKAIISKLHKVLRPYLLRRLKADVEKQMPAKYEHVEFCRLSKRQRELYDGFLARSDTKSTLASGNYMSIINCLMQLRKVCNHPDLFIDRPIVTSMRMQRSIVSNFDSAERRLRKWLMPSAMDTVSLSVLNLIPTAQEHQSITTTTRVAQLSADRIIRSFKEAQKQRHDAAPTTLNPFTIESNIACLDGYGRYNRYNELRHLYYINSLRKQQRPIYGQRLRDMLDIGAWKRPYRPRPRIPQKIMSWFEEDTEFIRAMTPTIQDRAESFQTIIQKFSCVTPAVITRDLDKYLLGQKSIHAFEDEDLKLSAPARWAPFLPKTSPPDPWHEARMRLTIQFPDKRLLQYDCGKLQVLDKLLRKLQSGGHRALIFTQMTKVLDILEQFLNIHGHKYLRLDGATKVEQRQILTDRFNNDPRVLCFILSTRSGGLGINLTGADTVIFYDQDWNPAMDKQCQDRCHRIGQTRDVHIYRLVSEHTIEANILRKASQKQMLDDVVIQEGEFTTDYFNRISVRDVLTDKLDFTSEGVSAADAALDRVLGGPDSSNDQRTVGRALEQAEDREDVAAARVAEREIEADDADFTEKTSKDVSGTSTARQGTPAGRGGVGSGLADETNTEDPLKEVEKNAWGIAMMNIDEYMVVSMREELKYTKLDIPKDKKKGKKKGRDTRKR